MALPSPPPVDEARLTAEDTAHLHAMKRALLRAEGFTLLLARANLPARSRELADWLKHEVAGQVDVAEITLDESITDLQALLARWLEEQPQQGRRAVFVYGLEHALPSDPFGEEGTVERRYPALAVLNLKRELLKDTVPVPIVLWLPEYAVRAAARGAPDFWAWCSGVFDFSTPTEDVEHTWSTMQDRGGNDEFDRMTPAERRERAQTLEALLEQYDARSDADTLEILHIRFQLSDRLGRLYIRLASYGASLQYARKALALADQLDDDHVSLASNNLGVVLREQGDLTGARAAYERALAINEAAYGPKHFTVAPCLNNLGVVLKDLGDLAGAREAHERALAIVEAVLGPYHPNVAVAVNNLGVLLSALGDPTSARAAYERALAIDEAAYGPEHPNVALRLSNLGVALKNLGDLAGARAAFERALVINEAAYGPEHPDVALDVNNLGRVLQDQGDLAGARASYERALQILERALGSEHPNTRIARQNLESLTADTRSG